MPADLRIILVVRKIVCDITFGVTLPGIGYVSLVRKLIILQIGPIWAVDTNNGPMGPCMITVGFQQEDNPLFVKGTLVSS